MSEQPLNRRVEGGERSSGLREIPRMMKLGVQLAAGAGGLILLFIGLGLIRLWNGCLGWLAGGSLRA
jgi:hypothetical protein